MDILGQQLSSYCTVELHNIFVRDVPDIRFRLAGYPSIFSNPVPAPVPAKMVSGTGYLGRIVLSPFCAFRASFQHCWRRRSHYWTSSTTAAW